METTFKYKDKIITTPNLEKKLKRMKITLKDIEIIQQLDKEEEFEEPPLKKEWRYFINPLTHTKHCCWVPIGDTRDKYELLKHHFNKEYIDALLCENEID